MKSKSGFILLMVLSTLAALILLVTFLVETVNLERQLSGSYNNKIRSRLLALSGVQYANAVVYKQGLFTDFSDKTYRRTVGCGTYGDDGFILELDWSDGKININDGIVAGQRESDQDNSNPIGRWDYDSSEINPWVTPGTTPSALKANLIDPNKSGLMNLRLRRILNAYGDSHKYVSDLGMPSYAPHSIGSFTFSSTAHKQRGEAIPWNPNIALSGLGDEIIHHRPKTGYKIVDEIKSIVNNWANAHVPANHYVGYDSFYDMIRLDLTIESYQDVHFQRLRTERAATLDATSENNPYHTATSPYMWHYQNDHTDCHFHPNYIDRFPVDLTDDSGNHTLDANGVEIDEQNSLWGDHSVALINMNSASFYVRSAVFYAPVNVSYLCEGALTHVATKYEKDNSGLTPSIANAHIGKGLARSSIGVRGPCFNPARMTENFVNSPGLVQTNRLMSLRDALTLSKHYNEYVGNFDIHSFDDFKICLIDYRKKNTGNAYERAEPIGSGNYFLNNVRAIHEGGGEYGFSRRS